MRYKKCGLLVSGLATATLVFTGLGTKAEASTLHHEDPTGEEPTGNADHGYSDGCESENYPWRDSPEDFDRYEECVEQAEQEAETANWTIGGMHEGETAYTSLHALWRNPDGVWELNPDHHVSPAYNASQGLMMRIGLGKGGYHVWPSESTDYSDEPLNVENSDDVDLVEVYGVHTTDGYHKQS